MGHGVRGGGEAAHPWERVEHRGSGAATRLGAAQHSSRSKLWSDETMLAADCDAGPSPEHCDAGPSTEHSCIINENASPRPGTDRFIPSRRLGEMDISAGPEPYGENGASPAKEEYKKRLAASLLASEPCSSRVLSFAGLPPMRAGRTVAMQDPPLQVLYSVNKHRDSSARSTRYVPQSPERILDAPDLLDDYYLNLIDWNAGNILGVALGSAVYMWNATTGDITQLMQISGDTEHITSVSWSPRGGKLMAIGLSNHHVQLWDTSACKLVRDMPGHASRVGVLAWNEDMITSGSRDSTILHRDTRCAREAIAHLQGHRQEVCGLKWAHNGCQLASGGNDNLLNVWDERRFGAQASPILYKLEAHKAAVKALAWCPWQKSILASGGGTADRTIRFWDMTTGSAVNAVDTHSQVCALQWSVHDRELVSSHGYSHNQLILWKYAESTLGIASRRG